MLVNKLYLLLIVIVVILLCKNTIEGFKAYKYDGLNYSQCASIPGSILCELSDEDCIKDDFSGFKNDGENCSVDGYSGTCVTIQVDEGGSNVDKKLCNVTNDEINRIYQSELNSNPPIDTYSGNNYYTIKKVDTSPDSSQQPVTSPPATSPPATSLYAYTHAPACSEDSSIASSCASLMEGEYVNCSNNRDCCLCNQSKWNKIYTSKNNDTPGNKVAQKSFDNIDLFSNVPSGDKEGYNIVKLDDTNKGNFTDRVSNDNFKRYFELPVGVSDKYYTPSKGYFFNQYNDNYQTEHVFNLNEYPGYIKSGPCGNTDQPQCHGLAPDSTSIMNDFFYEECLNEKVGDQCICDITSVPDTGGSQLRNPNCIRCPTGENKQGGQCVPCSETNKVIDSDGVCVTCDSLDYCNDRFKCIYVKNEQGEGECHQIDLHENQQVIRSDCVPKNTLEPGVSLADNCGIVSGIDYHLSNDTSITLDEFYSECYGNANCEVVQSIIDSTEGYINYNSPSVTTPVGTTGVINNDYNLITNEYCKSIDGANKCDQIKHCEWKTDKCLLDIHGTTDTNQLIDNVYYIPLPNVFNNSLELNDCSTNTEPNCTSPCEWTGTECINVDRCSISTPLPVEYESSLDGGIVNTELFDRNIKCKNLSSNRNHINDIKYDGDPKGFCLNDGTTYTMTAIGCLDSKELNDLILHKSEDYINKVVTKAYLTDLINIRESVDQGPEGCRSDFTGDGSVYVGDLLLLLAAYDKTNDGDVDGDSVTNVNDLLLTLGEYGCPGSTDSPEIHNIGVTTNHNLIADHLLEDGCISDPSDSSNCNIDESKSSKLIDTCRELCENNPTICNEYGVKFPTSVYDYSSAGCYLSKYCMSSAEVEAGGCIAQPCNTSLTDPYDGCIAQPCVGYDRDSNTALPYNGCLCSSGHSNPNHCSYTYTPVSDGCNSINFESLNHPILSTTEDSDESCRSLCSSDNNCSAYQYHPQYGNCNIWKYNQPDPANDGLDTQEGVVCYTKDAIRQ